MNQKENDVVERVAIVLQPRDELGKAVVLGLAAAGYHVAVVDSDASRTGTLKRELEDTGYEVLVVVTGLDGYEDVKSAVEAVNTAYGRIDVLVNATMPPASGSWLRMTERQIADALAVNSKRSLMWSHSVFPRMAENGYGRIVNLVPGSGRYRSAWFHTDSEKPGEAVLAAAAGGSVLAVTRQLAFDLAPLGIRVNSVAIGLIRSADTEDLLIGMTEKEKAKLMNEISLNRLGEPEEVATVVNFLCGPGCSYLTGATIDVNGGLWMS